MTNSIENKLPNDRLIRTKKIAPILLTTEQKSEKAATIFLNY